MTAGAFRNLAALSSALTPPRGDAAAFTALGLAEPSAEELASEHATLFGSAGPDRISPYAGLRDGRALHGLLAAYADAGLEPDPECRDRPDHVSAVLACLARLARIQQSEAVRGCPEAGERARARRVAFFCNQALPWLPAFFDALAAADSFPIHQSLALVAADVLRAEGPQNSARTDRSTGSPPGDLACKKCGGPLGVALPAGKFELPAWGHECVRCRVSSDLVRRMS